MIRSYLKKDEQEVITLLRLNSPKYFDPSEEKDFIDYLNKFSDNYFVFLEKNKIIACGGFNFFENKTQARISWDIVHPDFHGKGIGKKLTLFRINEIKKEPTLQTIIVRTSQLAYQFYGKLGFELKEIKKDFWALGFDLYLMELPIK